MKVIKIFLLFLIFCFLGGCSGIKETVRGIVGISTKVLEDTRKDALKEDFSGDLATIHKKIKDTLKSRDASVYRDDLTRNFIALYVSEADTTPVGIFLTEIDKNNTRVEVSSPSAAGKEFIAGIVFNSLSENGKPKDEKGKLDAEK